MTTTNYLIVQLHGDKPLFLQYKKGLANFYPTLQTAQIYASKELAEQARNLVRLDIGAGEVISVNDLFTLLREVA